METLPLPWEADRCYGTVEFMFADDPLGEQYQARMVVTTTKSKDGRPFIVFSVGLTEHLKPSLCFKVPFYLNAAAEISAVSTMTLEHESKAACTQPPLPLSRNKLSTWLSLAMNLVAATGVESLHLKDAANAYISRDQQPLLSVMSLLRSGNTLYPRYGFEPFEHNDAKLLDTFRSFPLEPVSALSQATLDMVHKRGVRNPLPATVKELWNAVEAVVGKPPYKNEGTAAWVVQLAERVLVDFKLNWKNLMMIYEARLSEGKAAHLRGTLVVRALRWAPAADAPAWMRNYIVKQHADVKA